MASRCIAGQKVELVECVNETEMSLHVKLNLPYNRILPGVLVTGMWLWLTACTQQ
jgi:hypothetical protein